MEAVSRRDWGTLTPMIAPALPVVGLTAHAMVEEEKRCMEAGMAAHLAKLVDIDHMVTVLLQHLPTNDTQACYTVQATPR